MVLKELGLIPIINWKITKTVYMEGVIYAEMQEYVCWNIKIGTY